MEPIASIIPALSEVLQAANSSDLDCPATSADFITCQVNDAHCTQTASFSASRVQFIYKILMAFTFYIQK